MEKFTRKQLLSMANEERKAAQLYSKMGMWRFARDEQKHAFIFNKMAKRLKK